MPTANAQNPTRPVIVHPPRASDAVGSALRGAYCKEAELPEDMILCLRKLNDNQRGRSRA